MSRYSFKLPDIGEGIAEAEIVAWHVKVGDTVAEDDPLCDMMTDKATVEMTAPVAGKIVEVAGEVGDQIAIGSVLAVFETEAEAAEPTVAVAPNEAAEAAKAGPAPAPEPSPLVGAEPSDRPSDGHQNGSAGRERGPEHSEPQTNLADGASSPAAQSPIPSPPPQEGRERRILASPAVRERARNLGIDLAQVKAEGDRIRHSDLDAYLLYKGGSVSSRGAGAPRRDETIKVVGLRRKIAENMQEAKRRIPHFTLVEEFDVTALEETRAMMNADRGSNPKLTLLPFLITAMARALPDWPMLNATYDDDANVITRHGALNLGMATQTPNGLMVPVIRDARNRSVWDLAREIRRLAEAARSGKATREELSGSSITLSSLGPMGGITSTPVINRPEVAIIAVNKVEEKLVPLDGEIAIRKRMNLSLSCDHRVVDGWDAASFMQALKGYIENPLRLLSA